MLVRTMHVMQHIYVVRGCQGAGKSTYARRFIADQPNPSMWKYLNKDNLRSMFDGGAWSKDREKFIHKTFMKLVSMALAEGFNVVCDNTHPTQDSIKPYHQLAERIGDVTVSTHWLRTPLDECLCRNALREGTARVPDDVIIDLAKKIGIDRNSSYVHLKDENTVYSRKEKVEKPALNDDLPSAIICDLDGTLAIIGDRSPYDASRCDELDAPNRPVVECVKALYNDGYEIIFMSGREEKDREATERFIGKHLIEQIFEWNSNERKNAYREQIMKHELFMRSTGDQRKDSIVKRELFDQHVRGKFNVEFVIDDRQQVVDMWRTELGLTVFQCAERDF